LIHNQPLHASITPQPPKMMIANVHSTIVVMILDFILFL